jgi:hypothetical protein
MRGGINRLKVKGAARADSLYDLTNAYLTQAGTIVPREGTIRAATLTNQTVGLTAFNGQFNVFATSMQTVPAGYVCNLLIHPTNPAATLTKIWFAKPFMGFPYVVAQFSTGEVFHYWLQSNGSWAANTVYKTGAIVTPTPANGLAYQALRDMPANSNWTAQSTITAGTVVEPTQYTGYAYRAVSVLGSSPHTGSTEPIWPTTIGGIVQEFGDFDTSSSSSGTTQASSNTTSAQPLGSNITDRYGNSATISGNTGTSGNASTTVQAAATVTTWAPGTTYPPGSVVQPSTNQGAFINAIPNGDFEAGNDGNWTLSAGDVTIQSTNNYQGNFSLKFALNHDTQTATMFNFGTVTPGQSVTASAYLNPNNNGPDTTMWVILNWYNSSDTLISSTQSAGAQGGGYRQVSVTGNAPTGAAHVRVQIKSATGTSPNPSYADLVTWNLETAAKVSNFLYEAVQANAGSSGTTEPTWPTTAGNTVIDNQVTWKAIGTSIITWQAIPIMQSGASQPAFPTTVGNSVHDPSSYTTQDGHVTDTSMSWVAINRQVATPNPNVAVCLGASHVFNADNDIVDYSAAVDPTDWTSTNNAGYLPTGLNNYGDNPVKVLGLYRSNLVAMNSGGYQMWQIDPDPQNMALLDAQPVGSIHTRGGQSVANDFMFVTEVGIRNLGTVGATANMQTGGVGQPVDPIVKARLKANLYDVISLYYPGRGQYWAIWGPEAIVLTVNGPNQKSWSRYTFPDVITDWCLLGEVLYLRSAGNLVWQFDYNTLVDDASTGGAGGTNVSFTSTIQWPYLDAGVLGVDKMMVGVDLVGTGACTLQVGWNQQDNTTFSDNAGFATSPNVSPPFTVSIVDTVPGEPIPIPMEAPSYTVILSFNSNQPGLGAPNSQSWEWEAANLYVTDRGGGGATG